MPRIRVSTGTELYYERVGQGPPLLLIMGTGLDHSVWAAQVEAYGREFECLCFDNRGIGRSQPHRGELTTRLLAEDAAAMLDGLGIERAHVSGLSLGSCVAQELTLLRPEMVLSLQLHGTWARAYGYAERKFKAQILLLETMAVKPFYEINVLFIHTPEFMARHGERVAAQIEAIAANAPSPESIKAQYLADLNHDSLARLPGISAPTLVTVGSFDTALPPMYAREAAQAIPGAELVVFEGGGHLHNVEQPEEFNRVTLDFLRRHRDRA